MQRSGIGLVISGTLIVIGLISFVVGAQLILEGVVQEGGKINSEQPLVISNNFDISEVSTGVFVVQIMEFEEGSFSAKILDPHDIEIKSLELKEESTEENFEIREKGIYKLVIESKIFEDVEVIGALGLRPDVEKEIFGVFPSSLIVAGMAGLVITGIYEFVKRRSV